MIIRLLELDVSLMSCARDYMAASVGLVSNEVYGG